MSCQVGEGPRAVGRTAWVAMSPMILTSSAPAAAMMTRQKMREATARAYVHRDVLSYSMSLLVASPPLTEQREEVRSEQAAWSSRGLLSRECGRTRRATLLS
jgi:hypothetical protein